MPNYDLRCPECDHTWSAFMSMSARDEAKCPKCGAKAETDYQSKNKTVLIKGKGFYQENTLR